MTTVTLHCHDCGQQYVTTHTSRGLAVYDAAEDGWTLAGPVGAMELVCRSCRCRYDGHAWYPRIGRVKTLIRRLRGRDVTRRCWDCGAIDWANRTPPIRPRRTAGGTKQRQQPR